jgi:hypothetical protein
MIRGPFDPHYKNKDDPAWVKQEKRVAKVIKGRRTPRSGGIPFFKSDVRSKDFFCEAKETGKKSISLKAQWLKKISEEALLNGKFPLVALTFSCYEKALCEKDWFLIPASVFKRMLGDQDG